LIARPSGALAQALANCRNDAAGILKFTRRYGPLTCEADESSPFEFSLDRWRKHQNSLRSMWDWLADKNYRGRPHLVWEPIGGDEFWFEHGKLIYVLSNLDRLMLLDLLTCPSERVRKCKSSQDSCPERYFIARHLRQNYCSDLCARQGQIAAKLEWWRKHGNRWRTNRKKSSKETK